MMADTSTEGAEVHAPPGLTMRQIEEGHRNLVFDGERYNWSYTAARWKQIALARMDEQIYEPADGFLIDALMEIKDE